MEELLTEVRSGIICKDCIEPNPVMAADINSKSLSSARRPVAWYMPPVFRGKTKVVTGFAFGWVLIKTPFTTLIT